MIHQMTVRSPWLRLAGAGLALLGLLFLLALILYTGPVQASFQGSDEQSLVAGFTAPAQPGTPALTITVEATSTVVVPGQTVTYTIEFRHLGGTSPLQGRLVNPLHSWIGPHNDGLLLQAIGSVSPTAAQFSYGHTTSASPRLRWQGSLGPDSGFRIRYTAEVLPCSDPNLATIRNPVAAQIEGGGSLSDSAEVQVDCHPAVDPAQVNVQLDSFWGSETVNELVPGRWGTLRILLTNSDSTPAILGLFGVFPSLGFNIGMPPSLQRTATLGWKVEEGESRSTLAVGTRKALFLAPLEAGETKVVTIPVRLIEDLPPESELEVQMGYCITYDGRLCPGADPDSVVPPTSLQWLPPLTLTVRYRDLGDAPDSTSHHAAPMLAYGGVQANFPTVFDPGTGPEQGPAHLNPRPFHLGRRASPEAEADIGPDLDPTNNILPLINIPNRDRRDDGLALKLLSFNPCQAAQIPVRIVVRSPAVTYFQNTSGKGYLNLWLDGNHDGDWADSFSCPGGQRAFEHIVVDHAIDVTALGPGVHVLAVPTGLVPWSGQGAWLRATLSEKPSNKTLSAGGVDYGDGRGYAAPFLLGETEDYFLRPSGTPGSGPDMGLDLFAGWRTVSPQDGVTRSGASPSLEIHLTASYFKAEYRNEGSETAKDVVLTYLVAPALQQLDPRIVAVPELGDGVVFKQPGRIQISLGDIDPGAGGSIVLGWTGCLTCLRSLNTLQVVEAVTGSATIDSSDDINPANNQADASAEVPELIEFGFTSPAGQVLRNSGVTCHNDVLIRGRTSPNSVLKIFTNSFVFEEITWVLSAVLSADGSGTFEQTINLPNGRHQILVAPQDATPEQILAWDRPMALVVNNHLPWNPSSLMLTDSQGRTIQPTVLGFENQAGWYGYLKAGETYQLSLEYCGDDPEPVIQAHFLGQMIPLSDLDGDGVYTADISQLPQDQLDAQAPIAASAAITISIAGDNVETLFGGTIQGTAEGIVYDASSGQPLNTNVTLLQAIDADYEAGFDTWPGAAYGQANPQPTGSDGSYAFWPEPGTYHVVAGPNGYQLYRSWNVQTTGEPVNVNLPLTPVVADEPGYIVEIGPDGFEPSVLIVPPGAIVKWINTDISDHTSTSTNPALVGPGTASTGGWDSGRLSSGESYVHQFDDEGTFTYTDLANPANTAQVQVGGKHLVYLPLIIK